MSKEKKICEKHNVEYVLEHWNKQYRCPKCRSNAVKKRRIEVKKLAVEYKGGKCEICGYDKCIAALEFHHETNKEFSISNKGYTKSWERVKKEIEKCKLVCSNCHREIHAEDFFKEII